MSTRKICVFTGTRADYGHLYWLMKEMQDDPDLILQILVSGSHLSPEFGLTYKKIEEDGFVINEKVEMLLSSDSPVGIIKSMGVALIGFADALSRLDPDFLLVLGDRYEALAVAQAALIAKIPIIHLHGGETSEGAIDESMRHAITKMASYHFVAAEPYRQRVFQLGENPERCWNFGAPGLDHIKKNRLLTRARLEKALDFKLADKNYLITYHPATIADEDPVVSFSAILKALDKLPEAHCFFTYPNADANGRVIIRMIDEFVENNPTRAFSSANLGQIRYLSLMQFATAIIGNSSSGFIEAPAMGVPTVNIGARQQGRLRSASIIDVRPDAKEISDALKRAETAKFRNLIARSTPAYGSGDVSQKIIQVLKTLKTDKALIKSFYDFPPQKANRND